jgi:AcrR family transcriptional regulator
LTKKTADSKRPIDPMRVLRLMWDKSIVPTRGRKPRIALADVVAASIRLADAWGIEALSMRRVAAELKVGTMSLYTYIDSKAELVELMVDHAFGECRQVDIQAHWRVRVTFLAQEAWELYHRHPWILQTNLWRLPYGPHVMDRSEALFAALESAGLKAAQVVNMGAVLESFVQGVARNAITERETEQVTGESFGDYHGARMAFWREYFEAARYPVHQQLHNAGGFDSQQDHFEFGLARLLDGIDTLLAQAGPHAP